MKYGKDKGKWLDKWGEERELGLYLGLLTITDTLRADSNIQAFTHAIINKMFQNESWSNMQWPSYISQCIRSTMLSTIPNKPFQNNI